MECKAEPENYVGHDVVLYVDGQPVARTAVTHEGLGAGVHDVLEQVRVMGGKTGTLIITCTENSQLSDLISWISERPEIVAPEPQEDFPDRRWFIMPKRLTRQGKGQRKANRKDRWR